MNNVLTIATGIERRKRSVAVRISVPLYYFAKFFIT